MGAYMREKGYEPALVLCSTAVRAKETLRLILPALVPKPRIRYSKDLYLAEWTALLAKVHKAPVDVSQLLLIGHNPGMEQLAIALALRPHDAAERARAQRLAQKFPTAALAVFEFEGTSWGAVEPGLGRFADYVRPKDLVAKNGSDE